MATIRFNAVVDNDGTIQLPSDVKLAPGRVVVTVLTKNDERDTNGKQSRTSLADWAEKNAEHWGEQLDATDVDRFTRRSLP